MSELLRKLRGLAGMGLTWGASWGAIGAGIGLAIELLSPVAFLWADPVLEWALGMGAYGLVSGVGFGALLSWREGRRTLDELPLPRMAVWGVLGGAFVPVLFLLAGSFAAGTTAVDVLQAMGVTAVLGGTFAPGWVALARRGDRALPGGADGAAGLLEEPGGR